MTATLTFYLPEEQDEFRLASNASALSGKVIAAYEEIRRIAKYGEDEKANEALREALVILNPAYSLALGDEA
jgi:hypothetical protein